MGNNIGNVVDARDIEKGNPGIGGAHYCMLMLAHFLSKEDHFQVNIITIREYIVTENIKVHKVCKEDEVIDKAESINTDILILKQFPGSVLKQLVRNCNLKIIVWSHNFISSDFCRYIVKTSQIACNVFVSKQQYDSYIDDDVINKSTYI